MLHKVVKASSAPDVIVSTGRRGPTPSVYLLPVTTAALRASTGDGTSIAARSGARYEGPNGHSHSPLYVDRWWAAPLPREAGVCETAGAGIVRPTAMSVTDSLPLCQSSP